MLTNHDISIAMAPTKAQAVPPRELFWMPPASAAVRAPSAAALPRILAKGPAGLDAAQLKERGNEEFKERRYEEAKHSYTESLRQDPRNHVVWCNRSVANLNLGLPHLAAADALVSLSFAALLYLDGRRPKGCMFIMKRVY